ncbi:MAG: hypothetical protein KF821_03340 [Anaerolineales bacterium]|jgi:hypothetical protein|nr:hypothetical protein [Anaerolineales bacterium]MCW5839494.1 hypothetical protein [Anaerolineales bacterium]MCW5856634.1 hypothetical protein [Anaerolineales bacterium]
MARKASPPLVKPSNVNAIGVMNIVSGVINILVGSGLSVSVVLGTLFLGLVCLPLTLAPAILGLFEVLYGIKLLANPPQAVKPARTLAIIQIITFVYLNVITGVIGILSLTLYSDPDVKAYFAALNPDEAA